MYDNNDSNSDNDNNSNRNSNDNTRICSRPRCPSCRTAFSVDFDPVPRMYIIIMHNAMYICMCIYIYIYIQCYYIYTYIYIYIYHTHTYVHYSCFVWFPKGPMRLRVTLRLNYPNLVNFRIRLKHTTTTLWKKSDFAPHI